MEDVIIAVPRIKQQYGWDCGLACVQMVLRYLNIDYKDFDSFVKSLYCYTSIWTVDLAQILCHYEVKHLFTTICQGVKLDYKDKSFYRNNFSRDELRINKVFQYADEIGIKVKEQSVPLSEIIRHLVNEKAPIILLVDWNKLKSKCTHCNSSHSKCRMKIFTNCFHPSTSYLGHFIVLCGYSRADDSFFYNNPDVSKSGHCNCTSRDLEEARLADGTDEDIIFLYNNL